jgi:hypothetical protein
MKEPFQEGFHLVPVITLKPRVYRNDKDFCIWHHLSPSRHFPTKRHFLIFTWLEDSISLCEHHAVANIVVAQSCEQWGDAA